MEAGHDAIPGAAPPPCVELRPAEPLFRETVNPTPYALNSTPYTLHPTPYTQRPTPYVPRPQTQNS